MSGVKILNRENTGIKLYKPENNIVGSILMFVVRVAVCVLSSWAVCNIIFCGFNIECDYNYINKIIFALSLILSLLQINIVTMAGGYIFIAYKIYNYFLSNKDIIKGGLKIMANQCYSVVANALELPAADGFDNVLSDTYTAVNSVTGIMGAVITCVMVLITVRFCSKIMYAIGCCILFSVISFFECSVNNMYFAVILICLGIVIVTGTGEKGIIRLDILGLFLKRNKKYKLRISGGYFIQLCIIAVVISSLSYGIKGIYTSERFDSAFTDKYSENIKVTARDIAFMKYAEYKNFYMPENVSMGQLGYVAYVKPNVKTDVFSFESEPVREGKIYFKAFTGECYNYRYNSWSESKDNDSVMTEALKNAGADSREYEIKSSKEILYSPVYSDTTGNAYDENKKMRVTAYEYEYVEIENEEYNNSVNEKYLQIDEENKAVIDEICREQNFSRDDSDLQDKLKNYFENNFNYSSETGGTPYGKDFVNYFLTESKEGNFTQYASAITLIYRNLGIPARYVSGYVVEGEQTLGSRIKNGKTTTKVKQANMQSWVEIYDSKGGWQIVDIIPVPSMEELEEKYGGEENTYTPDTSIESYFSTVDKEKFEPANIVKTGGTALLKAVTVCVVLVIGLLLIIFLAIKGRNYYEYLIADNNKKAFIIMEKLKKKFKYNGTVYKELEEKISLKCGKEKAREIIKEGERCIFADKIQYEDIKKLKKLIKEI